MEIKVLGTGCAGCKALYETTKQAVEELALNATVVKEEDIMKIMSYNVIKPQHRFAVLAACHSCLTTIARRP